MKKLNPPIQRTTLTGETAVLTHWCQEHEEYHGYVWTAPVTQLVVWDSHGICNTDFMLSVSLVANITIQEIWADLTPEMRDEIWTLYSNSEDDLAGDQFIYYTYTPQPSLNIFDRIYQWVTS